MDYAKDLRLMLSQIKTLARYPNVDQVMVEAMLSNGYKLEKLVDGYNDWTNYIYFEVWVSMVMYILTIHPEMLSRVLNKLDAILFIQTEYTITNLEELETFSTWQEAVFINPRVLASCSSPIKYLRAHPSINQYLDRAIHVGTTSNLDQFLTLQTVKSRDEVYLKADTQEKILTHYKFMPIIASLAVHWL